MHRDAAVLFDEHGDPDKAHRERDLAHRENQGAEADRREATAALEDSPSNP
jgi:hypothetical protein